MEDEDLVPIISTVILFCLGLPLSDFKVSAFFTQIQAANVLHHYLFSI